MRAFKTKLNGEDFYIIKEIELQILILKAVNQAKQDTIDILTKKPERPNIFVIEEFLEKELKDLEI